MKNLSFSSKVFIAVVVLSGAATMVWALLHWGASRRGEFLALLLFSAVASRLRVKLPGLTGTMSVNLPFILVAVAELSAAEALAVGGLSALVQCLPGVQRTFKWIQAAFNVASMVLAISVTNFLYHSAELSATIKSRALLLAVAAAVYFAVNSLPVAIIISLTESKNAMQAWAAMLQLSYPYYLGGTGVAATALTVSAQPWQAPIVLLVMVGVFVSYRRYFAVNVERTALSRVPQATIAHAAPN